MGNSSDIKAAAALLIATISPNAAHASEVVSAEIDLLELHLGKGNDHLVMESAFAIGKGKNQFVLVIDGGSDTRLTFDNIQVQALYSRAISDKVTVLAGIRRDVRASDDLSYAGVGIEASLTDWLNVEHYTYLSQRKNVSGAALMTARWPLTKRLALEPRISLGWSAQTVPSEALGAGVSTLQGAIRLRQEVSKYADVYAGHVHERLAGQTRQIAISGGQVSQVDRAVIGLGLRF